MSSIHTLGQYFTTNSVLKEKLVEMIKNDPTSILEPSIGQGDLINAVKERFPRATFDMYEIDETIELLDGIDKNKVHYGDFIKNEISKKYKTIIGNPPYVKTKKGNLHIDFTDKCYELLDDNGELIFIVPSDFLKLTSSGKLLEKMMSNGSITHIYHPNKENLFKNASVDVIIFRYCKNKFLQKTVLFNDEIKYITINSGFITFSIEKITEDRKMISDYFDIYVGQVSGNENVLKNKKFGNVDMLNGENDVDKYIMVNNFPTENEELNDYLLQHKEKLISRGIRKFNDKNWYEFGLLRNSRVIDNHYGKECIYIKNITRHKNVAFIGTVSYFGGGLIMLLPKKKDLTNLVNYFNSDIFKGNFTFSGRFKIGQRQISYSYMPNSYIS